MVKIYWGDKYLIRYVLQNLVSEDSKFCKSCNQGVMDLHEF